MDTRGRFRTALVGFALWVAALGVLAFAYGRKPRSSAAARPTPAIAAPR